jgi:hypothetical protein
MGWRWWGHTRSAAFILLACTVPWLVGVGPFGYLLLTDAGSLEARRVANAEAARIAFIEQSRDAQRAIEEMQRHDGILGRSAELESDS